MDTKEQLLSYVTEELLDEDVAVAENDLLLADGLVDSVGLMRFVAYIEATYGCQIPLEDIVLENFRSITAVVAYLARIGTQGLDPEQ